MREVFYPGPAAAHYPRSSYFSAHKVTLHPGVNLVSEKLAQRLLDAELVTEVEPEIKPISEESTPAFEYEGPIPTEGGAFEPPKVINEEPLGDKEE